jgi:Ca2+-binding RTX toxin-like protein
MANINGTNGGEAINGTAESDNIRGLGGNDTINGGGSGDVVDGGDGNDYLIAGASDTIKGGAGVDTLEVSHFGSVASLDLSLMTTTNNVMISEGIRVSGIEVVNVFTGAFNDHIRNGDVGGFLNAGAGNDTIISGSGHDYFRGGAGDDSLNGGGGYDRIGFFSEAANGCTVDLRLQGQRQNTGAGMDFLVGFENVSGTSKSDVIIGDNGNNILWGSGDGTGAPDGFDVLVGNGGNDLIWTSDGDHTLNGGDGIDTLTLWGNGLDTTAGVAIDLNLQGGGAQDTGVGQMIIRNFENLNGSIHDDRLTGDRFANTLGGGLGGDTLFGGASADVLYGDGSIGPDWPTALSGPMAEFAQSYDGVNVQAGSDVLDGGKGDDILVGGLGGDTLTGGGGVDAFRYYTVEDSAVGDNDVITDFSALNDFLDLSRVDANSGQNGDQAFVLVDALTGVAGQAALVYDKATVTTTVQLDTDGDGEADALIVMAGRYTVGNMGDGTFVA